MTKFTDWLERELKAQDMSPAELSRGMKKDQSVISRIMSGERAPRPGTLELIAHTLHKPVEEVYRAAGILPPKKDAHSVLEEKALYLINSMETEAYQRRAISLLEYLKQEEEKERRNAVPKPPPHPSKAN